MADAMPGLDAYQGRFLMWHSQNKDQHRQEKNLISIDFYVQVRCLKVNQAQDYRDAKVCSLNGIFTACEWDWIT